MRAYADVPLPLFVSSNPGTPETWSSAEEEEFGVEETASIYADPVVSQLRPGVITIPPRLLTLDP